MNYAVTYTRSFKYYDDVDEVIFRFSSKSKGKEDELIDLISTLLKENQRAIINFIDYNEDPPSELLPFINRIKEVHNNMAVIWRYGNEEWKDCLEALKENNISFIFVPYASDYDMIHSMFELGASDIYVTEELAFDLKNLQYFRNQGVKIRIFPDIAQYAQGSKNNPEICRFWMRPEDVELYSKYIDILEIYRHDDRSSVIYKIYKQKQWLGNIRDLILDFHEDFSNTSIAPHFGQSRVNCRKKCMVGQCNICMNIYDLSKAFNQVGVEIIKKKDKEVLSDEEKQQKIEELKQRGQEIIESETD